MNEDIKNLEDLVTFGYSEISKVSVDLDSTRARKVIVFSMMGAIQSYAESILCLLKENRTDGAEALMRTIIETYIKLNFIFMGRSQENAVRYLLDDEIDRKNLAKKINNYLRSHPDVKENEPFFGDIDWESFIKDRESDISICKRKYPAYELKELPKLRQMTEFVDKENEKKAKDGKLKYRLESWYLTYYWYFSNINHLNVRGLSSFFKQDSQNNYGFKLTGTNDEITRVAAVTFGLYLEFLITFSKQFRIYKRARYIDYLNMYKKARAGKD